MPEDDTSFLQRTSSLAKQHKTKAALTGVGGLSLAGVLYFCPTKGELLAEKEARCFAHQEVAGDIVKLEASVIEMRQDIKRLMMRSPKNAGVGSSGDTLIVGTFEAPPSVITLTNLP